MPSAAAATGPTPAVSHAAGRIFPTASIAVEPTPPDPATEQQMRHQGEGFRTFGKLGGAYADTSNFAGEVLEGEVEPGKAEEKLAQVDKSLDNLLAFAPGGSIARSVTNPVLAGTVEAIKKEVRTMYAARTKGDYAVVLGSSTALTTQLSLLAAACFTSFGVNLAQQIVETIFQTPKPAGQTQPQARPQP
ncbi:hypothetical protein P8605_07765 [Streptomyces sp. T-3]|nr:hypothetical protein [Streptomyces sp. T-3]